MEGLTRLVSESMARHGFDRPLDYRRLHWSRWFRCESHHSLLFVPSKPGVFAIAEEIMSLPNHVEADAFVRPASEASQPWAQTPHDPVPLQAGSQKPEAASRRMLAVSQFFEDDDMAFVLDRMLSRPNSVFVRLTSGRYFVRFVVIEDRAQRRTICNALNQWMVTAAEKASGIGSHFATSLELTPATEYVPQPDETQQQLFASISPPHVETDAFVRPASEASGSGTKLDFASTPSSTAPQPGSGAAANIQCPTPFPSGF